MDVWKQICDDFSAFLDTVVGVANNAHQTHSDGSQRHGATRFLTRDGRRGSRTNHPPEGRLEWSRDRCKPPGLFVPQSVLSWRGSSSD
jgi:hypothetical protein